MQIVTGPHRRNSALEAGDAKCLRHSAILSRLPKKTICHMHQITTHESSGQAVGKAAQVATTIRSPRTNCPPLHVAAIPAQDHSCRYHVFVEAGSQLKKLELSSTARVRLAQRFSAHSGDSLLCDYVVVLVTGKNRELVNPTVGSFLINETTGTTISIFECSAVGGVHARQQTSRMTFRKSVFLEISNTGLYELQFNCFINYKNTGSEAHLLIKRTRVIDRFGHNVLQLASLSCVGQARDSQ